MKRQIDRVSSKSLVVAGLVIVAGLVFSGTLVTASIDIPFTVANLVGPPSKVVTAQAERKVRHASYHWRVVHIAKARKPSAGGPTANSTPSKSVQAKAPYKPVPQAKVFTYQTIAVELRNPNGGPVQGLHLVAKVDKGAANPEVINGLVTDVNGVVTLKKIGPLPVALEITVESPPAQADLPEWQVIDDQQTRLDLRAPLGKKVATLQSPYRVASKAAIPKSTSRSLFYQAGEPMIVTVERTVADLTVAAPAGATITTASLPDQKISVTDSGKVDLRLSMATLDDGPVPICVSRDVPAGHTEAVIETYPIDPYGANTVTSPPLKLVSVNSLKVPAGVDIMSSSEDISRKFGDLNAKRNRPGTIVALTDESQWWQYKDAGVEFKMRPTPFQSGKRQQLIAERIRITSPSAGQIGAIHVGSPAADVTNQLGDPDAGDIAAQAGSSENVTPGVRVSSYLDGGLLVAYQAEKVVWIECARPLATLLQGTTAFVPRGPARLYIASFRGNAHTNFTSMATFREFLAQLPSIKLVDDRNDADLVLDCDASQFSDDKTQLAGIVPLAYSCSTKITYSLFDTATKTYIAQNELVDGSANANYMADAALGAIGVAVLMAQKNNVAKVIGAVLGVAGVEELRKCIHRAIDRCPAIATRTAFDKMVQKINSSANFDVRVIGRDFDKGTVTLNAGTDLGVAVSTSARPFEFEVRVADEPLPSNERPAKADYYTAIVRSVTKDSCTCELRHVQRKINVSREDFKDEPAADMVKRIPDPTTGLVSARACLRFPEVNVEIPAATAETAPSGDTDTSGATPPSASVGNALKGLFHL
ncbi:MAG: hypothetical protein P4L33_01610 [Capsulimonadaceae bacterium]|nr:hypothetical protein [Capsulimonadaceae bacterium]